MTFTAAEIWRKYETAGVPASGPNLPDKAQIVTWGTFLEAMIGAGAPGLAYASLALLNADLAHGANSTAIVYSDATPSNNGLYSKSGASGVGSWSRIGDLPNSIVRLTVTGGTANAIVVAAPEVPTSPGSKLYLMTPTANNSGPTTVNGTPIKTALGSDLVTGSLLNNSQVLMAWSVDHYQLLISVPVDATGVLNDALAAATAAAASATSAAASASALGNQVHQYDTLALATAATIPSGVNFVRTEEYTAGNAGGALYRKVGSAPTHLAKFQSADGAWWEYVVDGAVNIKQFGGVGDGSTANDTALAVAFSLVAARLAETVYFPLGRYLFTAAASLTLPNAQASIRLIGDGSNATTLYWPNASGGITITAQNDRNTFHISDLDLTTSQVNSGVALNMVGFSSVANAGRFFQSDIHNVQIRGDDLGLTSTEYWATAISIHNWGAVDISNINTFGPHQAPGGVGGGRGLIFEGDTATGSYATLLNVSRSSFNYHATGALLGDYWQGVTFDQCNFNGEVGGDGIEVSGSNGTQVLLTVTNCQIDTGGSPITIVNAGVLNATFTGNTITVSHSGGVCINSSVSGSDGLLVDGNVFNVNAAGGTVTGTIGISTVAGHAVIKGNLFVNLTTGVDLQTGATNCTVALNQWNNVTTKVADASGSNNVGTAASGHMAFVAP